jgi:hypothetical protein
MSTDSIRNPPYAEFGKDGSAVAAAGAAVAADGVAVEDFGPATPKQRKHTRGWSRGAIVPVLAPQSRDDGHNVGNMGWLFANWGNCPHNLQMRFHINTAMKKNPAMVIGLAECGREVEENLRSRGYEGDPSAPKHSLESRKGYEYLTLRGDEASSVLVGLRTEIGNSLELLFWKRLYHGQYRTSNRGHGRAYSRLLIAKVDTDQTIGFLGSSHNLLCMHLHFHLANHKWPKKLEEFWPWFYGLTVKYGVKVLMGDFNMSMWLIIPELRRRGLIIDLAAWYPWKTEGVGEPMSDSCCMCVINAPGLYTLHKSLSDLHDRDESGILYRPQTAVAGAAGGGYDLIPHTAGPGQPLTLVLLKKQI